MTRVLARPPANFPIFSPLMRTFGAGDRLQRFRKGLNISQGVMASRLKDKDGEVLARSTYASYEQETAAIPDSILRQLIKMGFADPSVSQLGDPQFPQALMTVTIPKGPPVPCSNWSDPMDTDFHDFAEVDSFMAGAGRFACEVLGDSMYDLLLPGDLCVWQKDSNPKLGLVVIAANWQLEATAAQLKHDGSTFILHKLNPSYPTVTSDKWECLGFLVGIIRTSGTKRVTVFDPYGIRP